MPITNKLWRKELPHGPIISLLNCEHWGGVELDLRLTGYRLNDETAAEVEALFTELSAYPLGKRFIFANPGNDKVHIGHTYVYHQRLPKERELEAAQRLWDIAKRYLDCTQG